MTRILVVEDEVSFSDPLSYLLRKEGYDVSVAENGTTVTTVAVSDPDAAQTFTYTLSGPDAAQHLEPFGITHEHPFHDVPVLQGRGQVLEDTVHVRHHHVPLLGVELGGRGARLRGAGLAVHGELQCWGIRHGVSPRQFCVCPPVPGARVPRTCRARP